MIQLKHKFSFLVLLLVLGVFSLARAEILKPFILGTTPAGSMADVVEYTKARLTDQGFTIVGSYMPYPNATVICASDPDLIAAAEKANAATAQSASTQAYNDQATAVAANDNSLKILNSLVFALNDEKVSLMNEQLV